MALPDFSQIPIIQTKKSSRPIRWFYIIFLTPLLGMAGFAAICGDETAIYMIPAAAVFIGLCELIAFWRDSPNGFNWRYEIDLKWVHFTSNKAEWSEPLSSFSCITWTESVEDQQLSTGGRSVRVEWHVWLTNKSNPIRSVCLFKSSTFANRDKHLNCFHSAAKLLGLPAEQKGGARVSVTELLPKDQAESGETGSSTHVAEEGIKSFSPPEMTGTTAISPPEKEVSTIVGKSRSIVRFSLIALITIYLIVVAAMVQAILTGDIQNAGSGVMPIFFASVVFLVILARLLTKYHIKVTAEAVIIAYCFASFEYQTKSVERKYIRKIVTHSTKNAVASVALQSEGRPTVAISGLGSYDALITQRFLQGALQQE